MYKNKLTAYQAAKFLGVCKTTILNWHKNGRLIPEIHPITKARYYLLENLKVFLEQEESKPHWRAKK